MLAQALRTNNRVGLYQSPKEQLRLEEAAKRLDLSPERLAHRLIIKSPGPSDEFIRMVEENESLE
jgi:hypothetical protein